MGHDTHTDDYPNLSVISLVGDTGVPESLLAAAEVGLVAFGPESTVERVDSRIERYFGLDGESVLGLDRDTFLDERVCPCLERPARFVEHATRLSPDGSDAVDCHVLAGDGRQKRWLRCHSHPIADGPLAGGRIDQYVDVTAEKTQTQLYETLLENFPNGAVTLVDQDLRYTAVGGRPPAGAEVTPSAAVGEPVESVLSPELADLLLPRYTDALSGESRSFQATVGGRDYRFRVVPARNDDGDVFAAVGLSQDVTERTRRERVLKKRERILRQLHEATREFYPPQSVADVSEFVVNFLASAFEFSYVSLKLFDEEDGVLRPAARTPSLDGTPVAIGEIEPGRDLLWEIYRTGESQVLCDARLERAFGDVDVQINRALVTPVGDFGLTVAFTTGDEEFDEVDQDLVEAIIANAEAILRGLRSDSRQTALARELSRQETRFDELRQVVDTVQRTQRRVSNSETRDALEAGVCAELVKMDRVEFAWIGRPATTDTDLEQTAAAGSGEQYLDSVRAGPGMSSLPALRAAEDHDVYNVRNISQRVRDADWAKEALSSGFKSVLSIPLLYDDILYGVLTVYSDSVGAFDELHETLLLDVASLSVNYSRMLEQRRAEMQGLYTVVEFEFTDASYPLQRLAAATESEIRYDTVLEHSDEDATVLVTVTEGDADSVREFASNVTAIVGATRFGDDEYRRLALKIDKPFVVTDVGNHGGRVRHSLSNADGTRIRVDIPHNVSHRPLLDLLNSRYDDISLAAKHETTSSDTLATLAPTDFLTQRQYEVLKAAYYGGYYETPREVTGEDIADSFGISNPAVYNHFQAAHKKVMRRLIESAGDIDSEYAGLNI